MVHYGGAVQSVVQTKIAASSKKKAEKVIDLIGGLRSEAGINSNRIN